ncbi:MAG TPA: hypothetical protein VMJ10_26885 [Kofleriaceae bacterium]|nr:hypothetical protein [Kofleriaceae bacterium]
MRVTSVAQHEPARWSGPVRYTPPARPVRAAPVRTEHYVRAGWERPILRERLERPFLRIGFFHAPVVVYGSAPVYVATPFADGAMTIGLGNLAGNGIELASSGGATFVREAIVTYSDGRTQTIAVGQELDASFPALDLQTDGTPVASVTIIGSGASVSAYVI